MRRRLGKTGRTAESSGEKFRLSVKAKGSCGGTAAHERRVLGSFSL